MFPYASKNDNGGSAERPMGRHVDASMRCASTRRRVDRVWAPTYEFFFPRRHCAEAHAAKALCALPELYDGRGGMEPEEQGDVSEVALQNGRTFQISIYRSYNEMVTRVTSEQVRVR